MWHKRFVAVAAGVIFALVVAVLSFAAGVQVAEHPTTSIAARVPLASQVADSVRPRPAADVPDSLKEDFAVFWDAWGIIEEDFIGEIDRQAMIQGAINGMVESLDDPYTQYVEPEDNAIMQEDDNGKFEGIGAMVEMIDGRLTIVSPLKGSPADEAGLRSGDIILEVGGTPIQGMDLSEAVSLVRGPEGTTVVLTIQRKGAEESFKVTIERAEIELHTVESHMLTDEVGYLAIRKFGGRTAEELDEALHDLEEQGARALILDLRNNPGGFLETAVQTVNRFLDDGPAVWWQRADGSSYPLLVEERDTFEGDMVVLVNEGSASASEIVAGALQDSNRATLVGVTTFGKGSVQNVHQLRDGGSIRVTTARWLTREEHEIEGVGLSPDYHVDQPDDVEVDRQLNFAQQLLQNQLAPLFDIPYR